MELLIATHNLGKLREYQALLPNYQLVSLGEIGLGAFDVAETGSAFLDNAALKAVQYARASGRITLSDDSGLCVDALDGAPGVHSARYGGDGLDDAGRRAYLLAQMAHVPDAERTARFVCVIALHDPRTGQTYAVEGTCEGRILTAERGRGGFGYDALFVPDGYDLTYAEMPPQQKDAISHRGRAAQKLIPLLRDVL
ncbi:RdgB/HAM1 family non-canonical purine NTP pyrophosphatase [Aggregatilineales bacterium SYSU G02658]